jgi:hypothetical protein
MEGQGWFGGPQIAHKRIWGTCCILGEAGYSGVIYIYCPCQIPYISTGIRSADAQSCKIEVAVNGQWKAYKIELFSMLVTTYCNIRERRNLVMIRPF